MKTKMKWYNLIENNCPKCGGALRPEATGVACPDRKCVFFITDDRYMHLQNKLKNQQLEQQANEILGEEPIY